MVVVADNPLRFEHQHIKKKCFLHTIVPKIISSVVKCAIYTECRQFLMSNSFDSFCSGLGIYVEGALQGKSWTDMVKVPRVQKLSL